MAALGIDLGTATVRAALSSGASAVPVQVPDATGGLASIVSFATDPPRLGHAALGFCVTDPAQSVRCARQYLGRQAGDGLEQLHRARGGPPMTFDDKGPSFAVKPGSRSAIELSTLLIDRLVELAEQQAGKAHTRSVLTFPLSFDNPQYLAIQEAMQASQLKSGLLVSEPVAACVGLGEAGVDRSVVVVDVGASQMSASLLNAPGNPGELPDLLHFELENLAGEAVDGALVELVEQRLEAQLQGPAREMVRQLCVTMKHELSSSRSTGCQVPGYLLGGQPDRAIEVDTDDLLSLLGPVLGKLEACCERLRSSAGLRVGDALDLHIVGGTTRLLPVRTCIERVFGVPSRSSRNPFMAVALGAATLAGSFQSKLLSMAPTPLVTLPPMRPSTGSPEAATTINVSYPKPGRLPADLLEAVQANEAEPVGAPVPAAPAVVRKSRRQRGKRGGSSIPVEAGSAPPSVAPASDAPGDASERPKRTSIVPSDIRGGRLANPITPEELLKLRVTAVPTTAELDPAHLAVLLMVLRHPSMAGRLEITMEGDKTLSFQIGEGMVMLTKAQQGGLIAAFKKPAGKYRYERKPLVEDQREDPHFVLSFVVDALRSMIRKFNTDDILAALGDRMELAPYVGARQQRLLTKLALVPMEQRVVKYSFDGQTAARQLMEGMGVRRTTAASLLMLLTMYDLLSWQEPPRAETVSFEDQLAARVRELEKANHFQALGLHWSALDDEVEAAYRKLNKEVAKGQPAYERAPEACRRIGERLKEAYEVLIDPEYRRAYRKRAYPQIDEVAMKDFLKKKETAWSMRDDGEEEVARARRKREQITRKPEPG